MVATQWLIHNSQHSDLLPIARCADPACVQETWGVDVDTLAYSIIDCVIFGTDEEAFEAAARISMAYAERMQSRDARRTRIAAGIGESLSGADR